MAKAYIQEFSDLAVGVRGLGQAPQQPTIVMPQIVDFTAGEARSAAFAAQTKFVEIDVDAICSFRFGPDVAATTSYPRIPAGANRIYGVVPGEKVSFIINT